MDIAIVGSGPAAEAVEAACTDLDASVSTVQPDAIDGYAAAVVIAPCGSDAFARAAGTGVRPWLSVEVGGVGGRPLDGLDAAVAAYTDGSAGYRDLEARVASTVEDVDVADAPRGDRSAVRLAGAVAGRRLVRLLGGADLGGTVVEVPGSERVFLPVPNGSRERGLRREHRAVDLETALDRAERAVDDRVGLVTQVGEQESFPVPYYVAALADTTAYSDARAAAFGGGVDADWNPAFMKALGEALERYSAGVYRESEFVTAPEADRPNAVGPSAFVRPDGFPDPDPDEPIRWVRGEAVATGEAVELPAEFVHYPPPDARYRPAITTGLGLGNSGVEALLSGLYEVLERDATMLAWYSTFDPLELAVDDDGFDRLVARARAEQLSVTPLLVTGDVDVPVVAAAVHREGDWPRFAVGSGADLDPAAAARAALAEALQNWTELRSIGPERAEGEEGAIGRYADFPEAARSFVDAGATVAAGDVGPDQVPTGSAELSAVVERAVEAGLAPYASRLTPRDVDALGFEAVRVLVPTAQPLFVDDPFFGERAERVPRDLGFEPRLDRPFHPYP